ncbi:MAG TPA: amidohydrolase family protein [Patescibacteria group bacterium]|nr:amidohydrolase family protein [Patescibacteria group bacterium]
MIIDSHTHIDKANNVNWTPEQLITSMNEAGIDYSLVISNDVTHSSVEQVIDIAKNHQRFRAIGSINLDTFNKSQVENLINYLKNRDIVGVKLYPGYQDYYPFDERFFDLFKFCEDNNHPIMIHTGVLMVGCRGYLEQARPLHVDRIAHRFPKLKIVIAHMGNPWLEDTVAVMWKNPNVYTDFSGFFAEFSSISSQEADEFLYRMKHVKGLMGNFNRFLFGTDWPLYSQKEYLSVIQKIPFNNEEKNLIFSQNTINIFNLRLESPTLTL